MVLEPDISCLKILHHIGTCLGAWPPYMAPKNSRILKAYKVYCLLITLCYVLHYWFGVLCKYEKHITSKYNHAANMCVLLLLYIGFFVFTINVTTGSCFLSGSFNAMVYLLERFDREFGNYNKPRNRMFLFELVALKLCCVFALAYYAHEWNNILKYRREVIGDYVLIYLMFVNFLTFSNYAKVINNRFKTYNNEVLRCAFPIPLQTIVRLRKGFTRLKMAVQAYNKTFGRRILIYFFVVLTAFVQLTNAATAYVVNIKEDGKNAAIRNTYKAAVWALVITVCSFSKLLTRMQRKIIYFRL